MIIGYYEGKETELYIKTNEEINYKEINIISPYNEILQKTEIHSQRTSMFNGHSVLALKINPLDFVAELCLNGRIEHV